MDWHTQLGAPYWKEPTDVDKTTVIAAGVLAPITALAILSLAYMYRRCALLQIVKIINYGAHYFGN